MGEALKMERIKNPLELLQERFCLINLSGEIRIVDRHEIATVLAGGDGHINFYKRPEGQILINRFLEALPQTSKANEVYRDFLINPGTHTYDRVAFSPLKTLPTTLNYWSGFTVNPSKGKWAVIRNFLRTVICDNDDDVFLYLLRYLAHMIQRPEEKPGIMIVLLSGQGTGKGTFFRLLRKIWERTTLQVSDVNDVIGQFNAALERNFVICMDEAIFSGDRKSLEKLKSLITEPQCRIEQKYQPARTIESYHRFFAASNHDHFAQVDKDDRRFLFIRVSSVHKQEDDYFNKVCATIDDDQAISAMVYDLKHLDISTFNVRNRPVTNEHISQRTQSLSGFERYWYEVLHSGSFIGKYDSLTAGAEIINWSDSMFISTDKLKRRYEENDRHATRYQSVQRRAIAGSLCKLCPSAKPSRKLQLGKQERGYQLPSLGIARHEFEKVLGCTLNWDDDDST